MDPVELFWSVRKTVVQMLRDRGHKVSPACDIDLREFRRTYGGEVPNRGRVFNIVSVEDNAKDRIVVFFPGAPKLGKSAHKELVEEMDTMKVRHSIVVVQKSVSPAVKKSVENLDAHGTRTELFYDHELIVNVTHHELVPKHELLSDEERERIMTKYAVNPSQLPRIKRGDAIARYYGFVPGQLIRITRKSETAGHYVTYRIVF